MRPVLLALSCAVLRGYAQVYSFDKPPNTTLFSSYCCCVEITRLLLFTGFFFSFLPAPFYSYGLRLDSAVPFVPRILSLSCRSACLRGSRSFSTLFRVPYLGCVEVLFPCQTARTLLCSAATVAVYVEVTRLLLITGFFLVFPAVFFLRLVSMLP